MDEDQRKPRNRMIAAILITALVTFVVTSGLGVGIGLIAYQSIQGEDRTASVLAFADTAEVQQRIAKINAMRTLLKDNFLEDLTDERMLDAMAAGLADNIGNPYTFYMGKDEYSLWMDSMSGSYSGVGASVVLNKEGIAQVTEVVEGGAAEAAGIRSGDQFITVNGDDVTGLKDTSLIAAKVRGEEGTQVVLEMYRPSTDEKLIFKVIRKKIVSVPIRSMMLEDGIGYIQIKEFSDGLNAQFRKAMADLLEAGAENFVFDLRYDPGGSAEEVIGMLDFLLPRGEIARIKGRQDGKAFEETWESDAAAGVPDTARYSILVNGLTASASELFAGCLRDFGKAYLIGTQTYGKGSGTITYDLPDGSAINITTFLYYLPSGISIEGEGLAPDLTLELPDDVQDLSVQEIPREKDTQLIAALEYLRKFP